MSKSSFFSVIWLTVSAFAPLSSAFAWGGDGHRVICRVAWDQLTTTSRLKVEELIEVHDSNAFAETCLYADQYRDNGHRDTASWHFVNVPKGATGVDISRDCPASKSCVIVQIERDIALLRSDANKGDKTDALKFLAHFVGDVHQPLHVGHAEDRGGNKVKGTFYHRQANMHAIWDSGLLRDDGRTPQEIATWLKTTTEDADRKSWANSKPLDWANESLALARSSDLQYENPPEHFYFGKLYVSFNMPHMFTQLDKAGVRLASLLNDVFSQ